MGLKYSWIICNDVVTEEAVRRPSEAEIRHEEGFEVVTRRRRRRATGEDEVVGGGGWTVQKQQKKDVSFGGGGQQFGDAGEQRHREARIKWLRASLFGNKSWREAWAGLVWELGRSSVPAFTLGLTSCTYPTGNPKQHHVTLGEQRKLLQS